MRCSKSCCRRAQPLSAAELSLSAPRSARLGCQTLLRFRSVLAVLRARQPEGLGRFSIPCVHLTAQSATATQSAKAESNRQQALSAQPAIATSPSGSAQPVGSNAQPHSLSSRSDAAGVSCQAESLRLLEWPEVCQQVGQLSLAERM